MQQADTSASCSENIVENSKVAFKDTKNTNSFFYNSYKFIATIGFRIIGTLEKFFYWLGLNIAARPHYVIIGCIFMASLFSSGLANFQQEKRPEKLWIPQDSQFLKDSEWMRNNFPNIIRPQFAIFTSENILTKENLLQMLETIEKIQNVSTNDKSWNKICFKIPVVNIQNTGNRRKREVTKDPFESFDDEFEEQLFTDPSFGKFSIFNNFDPSIHLPLKSYCAILESFKEACWLNSILELWSYDRELIYNLTSTDIATSINTTDTSPVFGIPKDYMKMLGGIKYDENGMISSAESAMVTWLVESDATNVNSDDIANDAGTGEAVDKDTLLWEEQFIKVFENVQYENMSSYYFSSRSFGDISGETIKNDAKKLSIGFMIMFIYVQIMLGKFNLVEHRAFLSLIGIGSIAIGCISAYGICSAFGITYGPVHNILPFLMLGIGIDDMFVIVQCWNNLTPREAAKPLPERVGLALKHAGVSITITSLTDFTAFAIGATTVLPSLRSFCIYAAVGILATYILQATFFVAWFSLDQRRIESKRDGFLMCYKHKNYTPNECSQREFIKICFNAIFSNYLFKIPVKALVMISTLLLLSGGTWGMLLLKQEFDPIWFLPPYSYLHKYFKQATHYYPSDGEPGTIYFSGFNHSAELDKVSNLISQLQNEPNIIKEIDSWYTGFEKYVNLHFEKDLPRESLTEYEFRKYLSQYLFSPSGSKYRKKFKFESKLECLEPAPNILISSFDFKFNKFEGSYEHVPAMNKIKYYVRNTTSLIPDATTKIWARAFASWETDEVIAEELYRNLLLAMGCVFITTLILIANVLTGSLVLLCVILTLVDVAGMMHFWGLTIDVVSCIDLVLAIGLCVDYAAHIGHTFMTCTGTRQERAAKAVQDIGPAVLNGGLSTFLAFILLADSDSHVFLTYFKIFFLVVVFGLFHGLIFLPVLLSFVGPKSYSNNRCSTIVPNKATENNDLQLHSITNYSSQ